MKNMVNHVDQGTGRAWEADDEELIVPVHYSHCIRRNGPGKVLTKAIVKDYRLVYDKRIIRSDLTTLPYGY